MLNHDDWPMDTDALNKLCKFASFIMHEGEHIFRVVPLDGTPDNFMNFDRAVCEAGLKEFIRPPMLSDTLPDATIMDTNEPAPQLEVPEGCSILVMEIQPGVRVRLVVMLSVVREGTITDFTRGRKLLTRSRWQAARQRRPAHSG
jgi:hypothetical protein